MDEKVLIKDKVCLSVPEAAEYSHLGQHTIRSLLKETKCPFVLRVGSKQLVKRKAFEKYLETVKHL